MGIRQGRLRRRAVIGHPVVRAAPLDDPDSVVESGIRRRRNCQDSHIRSLDTDDRR
ncbi:hypothetical protein ACWDTI_12235 [Gordonia sp. NPDC003424]